MKLIIFTLFILPTVFGYSQSTKKTEIIIDTVQFNFRLKGIADITSSVPQIKSGINSVPKKRINEDLKTYFQATTVEQDSATYVKKLLANFKAKNLKEYFEIIKEQKQLNPNYKLRNPYYYGDKLEESFDIKYLSQNLLNVTISTQILPFRGQFQFFFESAFYDLRTGNKLEFNDFFSIDKKSLISLIKKCGFYVQHTSETSKKIPTDPYNQYIERNLEDLFIQKNFCVDFYFTKEKNQIYLMFKFKCAGPHLLDYGIVLQYLKPYISYFEFKNNLELWGKDIYSLIGYDYNKLGNEIQFENYTIEFLGSYLLPKNNKSASEFAIVTYKSTEKRFYFLLKTIENKRIIIDILEIQTTEFKNLKFAEYCQVDKEIELGIIAVVKDKRENQKFYYEIMKAWRANQKTGKFETIKKDKIKKCQNESNGF